MHSKQQPEIPFDNSYVLLPAQCYTRLKPSPVSAPKLVRVNRKLANHLGIDPDWLESAQGIKMIAGNYVPDGAAPISAVYAGYQFGSWNPQLGDGRAVLLGEVIAADGLRYDIQLKGSGRTPYSRGGDGRAPLGPVLREYIVSESMAAMGIPTTRTLAAVTTGDTVMRETQMPGGVLARVAQSHIRIGTFQYFASRSDPDTLQILIDHVIDRHYPDARSAENPCQSMLAAVIKNQAQLIAKWQNTGFIHGVMNSDNMLLSGETIDYGPCAFMDDFSASKVFSSIDRDGRYAYRNQPEIAHWNLVGLAQVLLPFLDQNEDKAVALATEVIDQFPKCYQDARDELLASKLGLQQVSNGDVELFRDLFEVMENEKSDFTLTFRCLSDSLNPESNQNVAGIYRLTEGFSGWLDRWQTRRRQDQFKRDPESINSQQAEMYKVNPVFIPRNHLVEEVIQSAVEDNDLAPFHRLTEVLEDPWEFKPARARYATPPDAAQIVTQTFCGT